MSAFEADGLSPAQLFTRFFHLEKLALARRANLDRHDFDIANQRLSGLGLDQLSELREGFEQAVSRAVDALLDQPEVRRLLDAIPFEKGDVIVAVGDSITDDALSWANQLSALLSRGRPDLELRVLNFGYTGDTTQEVISRFDTVLAAKPDWIIQLLGTNDARLHTSLRVKTTSIDETARNLALLRRLSTETAGAHYLPMTPPRADSQQADEWEPFRLEGITWESDDVRAIADQVRAGGDHVDVYAAFAAAEDDALLLPDGIHPSLAGQTLIVRVLLDRLSRIGDPTTATTESSPHLGMTERSKK